MSGSQLKHKIDGLCVQPSLGKDIHEINGSCVPGVLLLFPLKRSRTQETGLSQTEQSLISLKLGSLRLNQNM